MPSATMNASSYNGNQITLLIVVSVCFVISISSIVCRFLARRLTAAKLLWDDWCALIALVFSALTNILIYISISTGLGRHIGELNNDELLLFGLTFYIQELSWTVAMAFVVMSILAFYKRLFPLTTWLCYAIYAMAAFTGGWAIATFLTLAFQCTPVAFAWDRSIPGGHCVEEPTFFIANGAISMVTVFLVLLLPVPVLWSLQVSRGKKIGLIFSFTVGSFVCAMSVARLIAIQHLDSEDLPWSLVFPGMWSCVETNIGVASACIPSLTPLFRRLLGKRGNTPHASYAGYGSYGGRSKVRSEGIALSHPSRSNYSTAPSESLKGIMVETTVERFDVPDEGQFDADAKDYAPGSAV